MLGAGSVLYGQGNTDFDKDLNRTWTTYGAGKYEEAATQIREFLSKYSADPVLQTVTRRLYYLLALSEVRLQHWQGAFEAIEQYEKAPGDPQPAWEEEMSFWKGVALARLGKAQEAQAALEQFASTYVGSSKVFPAMLMIGTAFLEQKEFKQAAEHFEKLRSQVRGLDYGRVLMLELYALIEAEEFNKALAIAHEGNERLSEIPQVSGFETLILQLGDRLTAAGNQRAAIAALIRLRSRDEILEMQRSNVANLEMRLDQLRKIDPNNPTTVQIEQLINKIKGEIASFEKIENFDAAVQFRIASAFLGMQRYRETAFVLDGMLQRLPPNPVVEAATDTLVKCYAEVGRWEKVVEIADLFISKYPNSKFVPGIMVLKGQAFQEQREFEKAVAAFREVVTRFPSDPLAANALFLEGFTSVLNEDFENAQKIFSEVEKKFPSSDVVENAVFWRGQAYSMGRKYPETIKAMQEYLDKYPSGQFSTEARYRIAFAHQALSEFDQSIPMLEKFIKEHPQDQNTPEGMLLLADAKMAQGDLDAGIAILQKVPPVGSYREEAWFKIGKVYKATEQFDKMREHFRKFQDEFPKSARLAEAVYWEGMSWQDDQEKAREVYWAALERFGNDPAQWGVSEIISGLEKLSRGEEEQKQYVQRLEEMVGKAEQQGKKTLQLNLLWALAQAVQKESPEKARDYLVQAEPLVDVKADNPNVVVAVADALRQAGKLDEATALYRDIRRWNPLAPARDRVFAGLGEIAMERGEPDQAMKWFERFQRETPGSNMRGTVMIHMADIEIGKARKKEALAILEELLKDKGISRSQKVDVIFKMGELHLEQGEPKLAIPYFQRIYVMYGAYSELAAKSYLQSGAAFEKLEDFVAAARTYREFLGQEAWQGEPELKPLMDEARQRLEKLPADARQKAEEIEQAEKTAVAGAEEKP